MAKKHDDDDDSEEDRCFSFRLPSAYGVEGGVRMRISRISKKDLTIREGADLASKACQLACLGSDVVRGRVSSKVLVSSVDDKTIGRLTFMAGLVRESREQGMKGSLRNKHLPPVPMYLYGTVLSHNRFDACVGMTIGYDDYSATVVLERRGSRWVCTALDFG
ncbi:hypothetical protein GFD17_08550 [Bifidobacterium sp. SMB2]|uniref:Uncharacterized protein n=1 Tax=Bifidobacterium saimiriisciurei TaxID=2661627 RepID=A0ABX0CC91_9BIFI|nr:MULTISPECIES: hypothetical protein [Bifidobacterium]NEG96802.1 hypothetical protein [Bifidobacterium sp. SMB2]NEH12271.1 hypothetical protein [Bifidobacterium saimiriisciurei]